jgi:hypothetical protein
LVAVTAHYWEKQTALLAAFVLLFGSIWCKAAAGDELVLPRSLPAGGLVEATWRFDTLLSGRGFLDVEWTDTEGRIVEQRRIALDLVNSKGITFPLDLRQAVTIKNKLAAHLSLDASNPAARRERDLRVSFIVPQTGNPWSDYQIIMWQQQTPAGYAALKRLGVTAGVVECDRSEVAGPYTIKQVELMLDSDLRWYVENIATDFYSAYHRWFPDRPVNWRFLAAKRRYWANPGDIGAFERDPILSDPRWLGKIRRRLIGNVQALRRYRPLYYNLADEPGIADLSAFWDFDLSAASLAGMREWLKSRYDSLAGLNEEWGSAFASWGAVMPMTTAEAVRQAGQNFAPWGDFKEWMDVAFARAVEAGTAAVHEADPHALAAIDGAQIAGWGGYDYSHLAKSVDVIEPYDYGDNVEMIRSFNPEAVILTTSFLAGAPEAHRVWRELLRGTRGLILWDSAHEFVDKDGRLGERAHQAAPYFREIRGGLGALFINSERHLDPIGILYSPASWRIEWLLESRKGGKEWSHRSADSEYGSDALRTSAWNFLRAIEHIGLQPRFVSAQQIEQGELAKERFRVLILPHTIALSTRAADEIQAFVRGGGTAIADGEPGLFDEHGRRRARPVLADLFQETPSGQATGNGYRKGQAVRFRAPDGRDGDARQRLTAILAASGVRPLFPLTRQDGGPVGDVESYVFTDGGVSILALLHEPQAYSATSYREPDSSAAAAPESVIVDLRRPREVYDIRARRALGRKSRVTVELGPVAPVILAVSDVPLREPSISGPHSAHLGGNAEFRISAAGASTAAFDIVHLRVAAPDGAVVPYYSGNLLVRGQSASKLLPLADNDKSGVWHIRARDLLSAATATAELEVRP